MISKETGDLSFSLAPIFPVQILHKLFSTVNKVLQSRCILNPPDFKELCQESVQQPSRLIKDNHLDSVRYITASPYSQSRSTAARTKGLTLAKDESLQVGTTVNPEVYYSQVAAKDPLKSGITPFYFLTTYLPRRPQQRRLNLYFQVLQDRFLKTRIINVMRITNIIRNVRKSQASNPWMNKSSKT